VRRSVTSGAAPFLTTKDTKDTKEGTKKNVRASRRSCSLKLILNFVSFVSFVVNTKLARGALLQPNARRP
jgi:hypothetical protein